MSASRRALALALALPLLVPTAARAATSAVPGNTVRASRGVPVSAAVPPTPLGQIRPVEQIEPREPGPRRPNPNASPVTPGRSGQVRITAPKAALNATASFDGPQGGFVAVPSDCTCAPPDTQIAVGPTQILATVNGRLRTYSKTNGAPDDGLDVNADAFWSGVRTASTSDPHAVYDRATQRWYLVIIDTAGTANRILVAVSSGPTITGPGDFTQFWVNENVDGAGNHFADYPTLGIDANALYIGTNNFTGGGSFYGSSVYVVRKSSIQGAGPMVVTGFNLASLPSNRPYTPQGVVNPDPAAATGYVVGIDDTSYSKLDVVKVNTPGATPTLSAPQPLNVSTTNSPVPVDHLGNAHPGGTANGRLDAVDDRLFQAHMRNGHIITAHNIQVTSGGNAGGGGRDGARWYDIDMTGAGPVLAQSGTVFDNASANPKSYWIPTATQNGQGILAVGGSTAATDQRANTWFAARRPGDAAGAMDAPVLTSNSTFAYKSLETGISSPLRWGDYSATVVDPQDDQTIWTAQEYAGQANGYTMRVTHLLAPPPPAATATTPSTVQTGVGATAMTLTTTGVQGGVGWFDPGPGFARRLAVTTSCGATATAVTYGGPGTIGVTLNTTSATAGPCDVTVTNPDGQTATAPGLLTIATPNHPPTAVDDTGSTPYQTVLHSPSVLANDSDTDGDPLTAVLVASPAHGTVDLAADGTYTYTPAAGFSGPDAFTYQASDGTATSNTATVSITVGPRPNQAPVATDDSASTAFQTVLNGPSVLANDNDPDGDPMTAALAGPPAHGTVSLAADGTYTYTPAAGYSGPDSFTYRASDGTLQSGTATVSITVGPRPNRAPVATGDTASTPYQSTLFGASVLANDSDPDGDPLTAVLVATPAHGTVSLAGNGAFTYTPAAGYSGPDGFTYRASDGTLQSGTATVSITVGPKPPAACVVPRLKGRTPAAARRALTKAHCRLGRVRRSPGSGVRRGRILRTSPKAGTRLAGGAKVTVTVRR